MVKRLWLKDFGGCCRCAGLLRHFACEAWLLAVSCISTMLTIPIALCALTGQVVLLAVQVRDNVEQRGKQKGC